MIIQSTRVWTKEAFRPAQVKLERGIITALLPYNEQKLTFEVLHQKLKESIQIETFNKDTLKILNLI